MPYAMKEINEAVLYIDEKLNYRNKTKAKTAIVLGSGLGDYAEDLKTHGPSTAIPFSLIPHFGTSTVDGHKGELIYCLLDNTLPLITLNGRLHFYEGYEPDQVILPIRVLGSLGITTIILTNASGAIKDNFFPGELMTITDHINFTGHSPLVGKNLAELGPRFVDMTTAYDRGLIDIAKKAALRFDVTMHEGVYAGLLGPTYETPAEIRMLKLLGADAVGMSTVFETIAARHMGLNVLAISCLTNKAAGLSSENICHQEVIANNAKVASKLGLIISEIVKQIA